MIQSRKRFFMAAMCLTALTTMRCSSSTSNDQESGATFTPGTGDSLGTFNSDGASFDLQSDAGGGLAAVTAADGSAFSLEDDGALRQLQSADGSTYVLTRNDDDDTLTVDINDSELGELTVTVSLAGRPELLAGRSPTLVSQASPASPTAVAGAGEPRPAGVRTAARELESFEELDLGTFCQITNACALAELYAELFLDDVVNMIQSELIIVPRAIIQGRINEALKAQRDFCQEWNALVQELDDNPCTSSDDPPPPVEQDCSDNGTCNVNCPDTEPDPDCTNAEICTAKEFCCVGDQVCDIQRCNEPDPDCTNFLFCDRLNICCDDDDVCHTVVDGRSCPQTDQDCTYCGNADEVCIENCTPTDPDCPGSQTCPLDNFCETDCAGADPDCDLCAADDAQTCITACDPPDPDCSVVVEITAEGGVSSSSVFEDDAQYNAGRAVDGSTATNWFSDGRGGDGPGTDGEVFSWVFGEFRDTSITRIETDPETFQGGGGFGFASAQVVVQDVTGSTVYDSGFMSMNAFRVDLSVTLPEGTEGRTIILTLVSHQDNVCGGFSEFRVYGIRDVGELDN